MIKRVGETRTTFFDRVYEVVDRDGDPLGEQVAGNIEEIIILVDAERVDQISQRDSLRRGLAIRCDPDTVLTSQTFPVALAGLSCWISSGGFCVE